MAKRIILPQGFRVRLNDSVQIHDQGRLLVGGSPVVALKLKGLATKHLNSREVRVSGDVSEALAYRILNANLGHPVLDDVPCLETYDITIVVPVYSRAEELERLLASIDMNVRIIVVDDASPDGEELSHVAQKYDVELVRLPKNVGPAGARNAGLARVRTAFVVFVDSDIVMHRDTVAELSRHFVDPQLAVVGPRVRNFDPSESGNWIEQYEWSNSSLDMGSEGGLVKSGTALGWLPSAMLMARVSSLDSGFDESMRSGEDVDLVWRVTKAGWRVRYDPLIEVQHQQRTTLRSWAARKAFYGTSAAELSRRHPGALAPAILGPWSAVLLGSVLAQRRWSAPLAVVAIGWAWIRLSKTFEYSENRHRLASELTVIGIRNSFSQGIALLLRHWWPLSLLGAFFSRRIRRALVVATVADTLLAHQKYASRQNILSYALARRLDDLAYGTGLWWGVIKARSFGALIPRIHRNQGSAAHKSG